jgi:hypothetical protein
LAIVFYRYLSRFGEELVDRVYSDGGLWVKTVDGPGDRAGGVEDEDAIGVTEIAFAELLVAYVEQHGKFSYLAGVAMEQFPVVAEALLGGEAAELGGDVLLRVKGDQDIPYPIL